MKMVFDEAAYAKELLEQTSNLPGVYRTATTLGKLYYSMGANSNQCYKRVDAFLLKNLEGYNSVLDRETVDEALEYAKAHPLIQVGHIKVTQAEVDRIREADSKQKQRVLFVMLCLAKYHYAVSQKSDYWVTESAVEIFRMAHVQKPSKERSKMLGELRNEGFLRFANLKAIDNLNMRIEFVDTESPAVLVLDRLNELYEQWEMLSGKRFIRCADCGKLVKCAGHNHKLCKSCAEQRTALNKLEYKQRLRKNEEDAEVLNYCNKEQQGGTTDDCKLRDEDF